jgi:ABC-2 type transport system ATP-binding protein
MVARFGAALHVAGRDRAAMETLARSHASASQRWAQDKATLEDVFIDLMTRNHRNGQ